MVFSTKPRKVINFLQGGRCSQVFIWGVSLWGSALLNVSQTWIPFPTAVGSSALMFRELRFLELLQDHFSVPELMDFKLLGRPF